MKNIENMNTDKNKKIKFHDAFTAAIFLALIFGTLVCMLILPDRDYSEEENRALMQLPSISSDGKFPDRLFSGKFGRDVTDYLADQFPCRDFFVGLKAFSERLLQKNENNGFFYSDDGYITERCDSIDFAASERYGDIIFDFAERLSQEDIPVTVAVTGRSSDIITFALPDLYALEGISDREWAEFESVSGFTADNITFDYVNLRDTLKNIAENIAETEENRIYYRTDHHWTTYGAYRAYIALSDSLGINPHPETDFNIETVSENFYGTAWRSAGMKWIKPDIMSFWRYDGDDGFTVSDELTGEIHKGFYYTEYLSVTDKYSAFLGENRALTFITNGDDDRQTLLLVKDSFSHSLAPFLARHFNLLLLDCRYYSDSSRDLICEYGIDRVLIIGYIDSFTDSSSGLGMISLIH